MNIRLKVESYQTGRIVHYHAVVYPKTKTELGLKDGQTYLLRFTQDGMFFKCKDEFTLMPFPPAASHFVILKNMYIRTQILQVGQWYDVEITAIQAGRPMKKIDYYLDDRYEVIEGTESAQLCDFCGDTHSGYLLEEMGGLRRKFACYLCWKRNLRPKL